MSGFNFKSQITTSIEQSERLLALGLKKETADASIPIEFSPDKAPMLVPQDFWISDDPFYQNIREKSIPAWSLHRLIEMMPKTIGIYFQYTSNDGCGYMDEDALNMNGGFDEGNIYDSIISCIEWLINEELFNKEYLV